MWQKIKAGLLSSIPLLIIGVGVLGVSLLNPHINNIDSSENREPDQIGVNYPDAKWFMVDKFQGYQNKKDPTKVMMGVNPYGQNTLINDGDRISSRNFGYTILGTATTTEQPIMSLHTFRKRDGENILMRNRGTLVEYFEESNDIWETLIATSTSGKQYGFADYNINTDLSSYTYFGNAWDNFMRWNGGHTSSTALISVGDTSISVANTTGFTSTGTIIFCGVRHVYSAKTATTFTISTSTVDCAAGRGIAQNVDEFPTFPKGNIYLVANNRLFISGITTTPQIIQFSKYGDANTWLTTLVADGTDSAAGAFNLGEGGGGVTGMAQDEGAIYAFKKSITYKITLSDTLYTLEPLKPFDGRSQTTGNINNKMVFSGGNGTFFVTPDNQIMNLARVLQVDYPQITPISYPIQPTADVVDFTRGAGIFWKQFAFLSVPGSSDSNSPDTVLVYNDLITAWESPIIGWSVNDWAVYDNGTGESLYFGDANTANVYEVTDEIISDNDLSFASNWRSKQFDFAELGIAQSQLKEMDSVYVEGYISENTELTISLLLDEDGYTQQFSTTIDGADDTQYLYSAAPYNIFGLHPFGYLRFGSSDAVGKRKFRVYLSKDFRAYPFYNAQIEFGSDSAGQSWEVTTFGFRVRGSTVEEKRSLFKSFN